MNKYSTPQQPDNDKAQGSEYQIQVYNSNKLEQKLQSMLQQNIVSYFKTPFSTNKREDKSNPLYGLSGLELSLKRYDMQRDEDGYPQWYPTITAQKSQREASQGRTSLENLQSNRRSVRTANKGDNSHIKIEEHAPSPFYSQKQQSPLRSKNKQSPYMNNTYFDSSLNTTAQTRAPGSQKRNQPVESPKYYYSGGKDQRSSRLNY